MFTGYVGIHKQHAAQATGSGYSMFILPSLTTMVCDLVMGFDGSMILSDDFAVSTPRRPTPEGQDHRQRRCLSPRAWTVTATGAGNNLDLTIRVGM